MKKIASFFAALTLVFAAQAQTLNVVTGDVTYQFPASSAGDMTYTTDATSGTTLTIQGKVFNINDITKIYVDDATTAATGTIDNNTIAVAYNGTTATVTVAGNVAQYITPTVSGAHVSILQTNTDDDDAEITYTLSGSSSDGEFYMKGTYKATIQLNGVTLTNTTPVYSGAALHIQDGKRINISVKKDTENTLTDCASPSEDLAQKACLYVKGHPEFKGKGTLNVYGKYKHAIKAGEYISVKNCTINVKSSAADGINCNQYFLMESGTLAISSVGDDGIQAEIDEDDATTAETADHEDENSGNIYIADGSITATITAKAAKGIKADGNITVSGGTINVTTSGSGTYDSDEQDAKGSAGLSADGDITITGGTITAQSTGSGGKGLKCDNTLTVSGGTINATASGSNYTSGSYSASAKAIKAGTRTEVESTTRAYAPGGPGGGGWSGGGGEPGGGEPGGGGGWPGGGDTKTYTYTGGIVINGGTIIAIAKNHEAIESKSTIEITDGYVYAESNDDAINSASDFTISGGYVMGNSSGNDGLDANGDFYIKGGNIFAIATTSPEVGIDANSEGGKKLYITGGNVVAIGGLESDSSLTGVTSKTATYSKGSWYTFQSGGTTKFHFKVPTNSRMPSGMTLVSSSTPSVTTASSVTSDIWNGYGATN